MGSPGRGWRHWLTLAGLLALAGGFCALVQGPLWEQDSPLAAVNLATSLLFVLTGLMILREPGQRGAAFALMLAGVLRSVDFIDAWNAGPWPVYGLVFGAMDRVFGAWALLRYPNPSLQRHQRAFLTGLVTWMLAGRTAIAVTSTAQWNNGPPTWWWPALWPDLGVANVLDIIQNTVEGVFGLIFMALLVRRLIRTTGLDRIVIPPVIVAGLAATLAAIGSAVAQLAGGVGASPNVAYLMESVVDFTVPLAFLVTATQRALLLRAITGLTAQLSTGADVSVVRNALRAVLHDPTLDVLEVPAAETGPEATGDDPAGPGPGQSVTAAVPDGQAEDRMVEFIRTEAGKPIAVVLADPSLARYRGLFDAAVQTSGLALQNAQLQARAARAELEQVRASRTRIVEVALAERRRLERDLHDGVQQHLLGLAAQLSAAMTGTRDSAALTAFGQVRDGLSDVLAELRDLAHGIHPALLSQGGLAAALDDVAERLPLPVRVSAPAARAGPAVEATAYFVACEALTNVVKHARARSAAVVVGLDEAGLRLEISDDGVGGAGPAGHGLASIADRVHALDGDMTVDSPPGQGTRLMVRIPCG